MSSVFNMFINNIQEDITLFIVKESRLKLKTYSVRNGKIEQTVIENIMFKPDYKYSTHSNIYINMELVLDIEKTTIQHQYYRQNVLNAHTKLGVFDIINYGDLAKLINIDFETALQEYKIKLINKEL